MLSIIVYLLSNGGLQWSSWVFINLKNKLSLVNSLNFWHFKQIIFLKFDNSKNNLIIAKPEKLLMVTIYRQGFGTLLAHIFLSFFLEESVEGSSDLLTHKIGHYKVRDYLNFFHLIESLWLNISSNQNCVEACQDFRQNKVFFFRVNFPFGDLFFKK
jgi:hypothetical protein